MVERHEFQQNGPGIVGSDICTICGKEREDHEPREWLIRKDGYYYRPNRHGYTTRKVEAGLYTKADAEREAAIEPWHMSAIHKDDIAGDWVAHHDFARLEREKEELRTERDEARVNIRAARRLISATHKNAVKHDNCQVSNCPICEGGLFVCADCGAAEVETEERICTAPVTRAETAERQLAELRAQNERLKKQKAGFLRKLNSTQRQLAERDADLARVRGERAKQIAYSCDLQRIIEGLCGGGEIREPETTARYHYDMAVASRAALAGSGDGWREMSSAPETGFFLAWTPDFPDMVSCWKAEIFHQARKPGTPRHLSANHFTLWRPLDLPASPSTAGER